MSMLKKEKRSPKQKIYWGIDNVVLNTTEAAVELSNKKYQIPNNLQSKTKEWYKDQDFKGLQNLTKEQQKELFESSDFWNTVTIKPEFYDIVRSGILDKYDNIFITKDSTYNLFKKKKFLYEEVDIKDIFKNFDYIVIADDEDKASIDMTDGIQIDDNYLNLKNTKARVKILVKNYMENATNNSYGMIDTPDNLYNVNSLDEVFKILEFNLVETL